MRSTHDILRERLLLRRGMVETPRLDLEELRVSEWSPEFEELMRNRLLFGAYRYGKIHDNKGSGMDWTGSIEERLELYREDGNLEHLVDIANLCLCEYEVGSHPNRHFGSTDDGVHVERRTE